MPEELAQTTVYEETLGNVKVQVHRVEEEYQIILLSAGIAYFSTPFTSLEDCKAEIKAMKELDWAEKSRREVA